MSTYSLTAGWRRVLSALGLDPAAVLRHAGLPADLPERPQARIGAEEFFALWEAADALYTGPDLAVAAASAVSADHFDAPVFAGLASRDLAQAAARIAVYKRLIYPVTLDVRTDTGLRIALRPRDPFTPPAVLERFELLFWVAFARLATGVRVGPARITVPAPPDDQSAVAEFLDGVRLTRGHRAEVVFSPNDMHRPFVTGVHTGMWEHVEPDLRRRLRDLEESATWAERTHTALLTCLPAGRGTLADVAAELATSPRTLQRRLGAEGTSFQKVLAQTRERMARAYLRRSSLSYTEIAFLIGYGELTSLHRALRQWTGETPRGLRSDVSGPALSGRR
ncbi:MULTISPECIES: AraC family transcriptional regulator [unclassified Streptomyces]|uniref:AraC family transcriptional regulator n=1 Tax=unclassified Streptomyces TaxID=2593676 RepID=UPI001F04BCFC|nr:MULTISPECIES: AraC family transcriptional regulator [unclassified Streptomyces]MCH0561769.1 AraC family transcriptional regulator ligand-binding domain-containing protein [Streptomyces sp. MUM 2J]MCH0571621.1 AraC family transcriptional regulator ligand-binding domain-containing protein [Streptomyces sp. MUM 136J]